MAAQSAELVRLIEDWIATEVRVIGEFSGNFQASYRQLIGRAKERCAALNVEWSDDFVPGYVLERLTCDECGLVATTEAHDDCENDGRSDA